MRKTKFVKTGYPSRDGSDWESRTKGSEYEGRSCRCGANNYRLGSGYCVNCGHPPS